MPPRFRSHSRDTPPRSPRGRGGCAAGPTASAACLEAIGDGHGSPRDAGGSRTHFDRVAAGCLAVWLQRPWSERDVPARSRTWPSTFARSCASLTLRGREGSIAVPPPGAEPGPRPSEGRVPSDTPRGQRSVVGSAGTQGFEPCGRALEARCSPRSTPLSVASISEGVRRDSNPPFEAHNLGCCRYTTDTIDAFGQSDSGRGGSRTPKACARPPSTRVPSPIGWPFHQTRPEGGAGIEPATSRTSRGRSPG